MASDLNDSSERIQLHHPGARLRRLMRRAYSVIGAIANLLGIYAFGETHHWWSLSLPWLPQMTPGLWGLAAGIGGPWAMILGTAIGTKLSELFTRDNVVTRSLVRSTVNIGMFFAMFHSAEVSVGIPIYPDYESATGFAKVVAIYLALGLGIGILLPPLMLFTRRTLSRRKGRIALNARLKT